MLQKSVYITDDMNVLGKCNEASLGVYDSFGSNDHTINTKDTVLTEMNSNSPFTIPKSPSSQNETPVLNSTPINFKDGNNEVRQDDCRSVTTPRRNSVKRNLNKSFGDTHNYSIVELEDDENWCKLRLRKSRSCVVKKTEHTRKSMRNVQRKSYAEYESPLKSRKQSVDDVYSSKFSERTSKVVRSLNISPEASQKSVSLKTYILASEI